MKTILDLLESKGLPKVKQVWDYNLIGPSTVDDAPELYLSVTDVVDGKASTKRAYLIHITQIKLEEIPVWPPGGEPKDPFAGVGLDTPPTTEMERGGKPFGTLIK